MKKIFMFVMPCLVAALSLTSCNDTMDDKAVIDAQYEGRYSNAVVNVSSTNSPDFQTVEVTAAVANADAVAEQGIMLSSDASFETVTYAVNDTVEANYTLYVTGLQELTKYYVRAYAVGKNGVTVYSETKEVTTVAAPMVSIEGTYTVVDYKNGDSGWEQFCNPYKMTIEFEEGSNDIVNITGLALGSIDRYSETEPVTFQGLYDAETNTITIPNNSVVANTADYGQVWSVAYQADALVLNFNPKGGSMESQIVRYACAAGNLGYFYHEMQHD
jgi:hypothetical protein